MTNYVRLCGLPVVDEHEGVAGDAGDAVHLLGGERRQDENPSLVVADAALVLHLVGHELIIGVVISVQSISP